MIESFFTTFIIYFVVIDPIGNSPIFLAVTAHHERSRKLRIALEATAIATVIMLFFALCGAWVLSYLKITEAAFKIAGGILLFLIAFEMLSNKRQNRKRANTTRANEASSTELAESLGSDRSDNVAVYPLATPLLAGPSAILSVIVVTADHGGSFSESFITYMALFAVMGVTGIFLASAVFAEKWLNVQITMVISRIIAIILAGLAVQYVIDGLAAIGVLG